MPRLLVALHPCLGANQKMLGYKKCSASEPHLDTKANVTKTKNGPKPKALANHAFRHALSEYNRPPSHQRSGSLARADSYNHQL